MTCFINLKCQGEEDHTMETEEKVIEKKEADKPPIEEKETGKKTDLCCCYVVDRCGRYIDPCFTPVSSCCC